MDTGSFILTLLNLKGWGPKKIYSYALMHKFNYENCVKGLVLALSPEEKDLFKFELIKAKSIIEKNKINGISVCTILDNEFPKKLYSSTDKCVFLFYRGNINLLNKKSISIIGTRKPSQEFIEKGEKLTKHFASKGYVIVSGLALGCDTVAHKSCIDVNGKTIAVLPSPCDNIQPSSNKKLAQEILNNDGLLISEYGTGDIVTKYNYPRRDRIQSLLSSTLIIIQASNDSGTMIAANKSINDMKNVYAIKGNNLAKIQRFVDVDSVDDLNDIEQWIY